MCCGRPDGAAAARQSTDSWLTCIPPEPKTPQIASTTFEAEGVRLPPQQLKELKAIAAEGMSRGSGQWEMRNGMAYWTMCPASFLGLIHPSRASPSAAPHLSRAPHPCPLRDHPSEGLSSGPEEVHGGSNLAALGLRNAATPSTSTMQVRSLQAGAALPKWEASKRASRRLVQDGT